MAEERDKDVWEFRLTDWERRELMQILEAVRDTGVDLQSSEGEDLVGCGSASQCFSVSLKLHFFHRKMKEYTLGAICLLRKLEELPLIEDGG